MTTKQKYGKSNTLQRCKMGESRAEQGLSHSDGGGFECILFSIQMFRVAIRCNSLVTSALITRQNGFMCGLIHQSRFLSIIISSSRWMLRPPNGREIEWGKEENRLYLSSWLSSCWLVGFSSESDCSRWLANRNRLTRVAEEGEAVNGSWFVRWSAELPVEICPWSR